LKKGDSSLPVITISRQMCSFGDDVAAAVARRLNWELISRKDLFAHFPAIAASPYDLNMLTESAKYYLKPGGEDGTFLDSLKRALEAYLRNSSAVLTGFGSQVIFADWEDALHVRIIASKKVRIARAKKQYRVSDEEAEKILDKADKKHRKFVSTVFGVDLSEPSLYHLILNTSSLSVDECAAAVIALYQERELLRQMEMQTRHADVQSNLSERPSLKNQSEEEFARLLDMYQLDWKYEPKTFPIEWDAEGNVTAAFSPDFYLTKFDTYIELTTMDQKYVTAKNKKVNKVRELYPGTNINIVYKKDFESLIERFNLNKGDL
jgi:cytidylate kinase